MFKPILVQGRDRNHQLIKMWFSYDFPEPFNYEQKLNENDCQGFLIPDDTLRNSQNRIQLTRQSEHY
jgi:hypothetical protein